MESKRYNCLWLSVVLFCISVLANAQQIGDSISVNAGDSTRTSVIVDELMITRITMLEKDLVIKNTSIDSLNQVILRLNSEIVSSQQDQAQLNTAIRELRTLQADTQQKLDRLNNQFGRLDGVIYKQCLLYPLEAKYNETNVQEAISSIESLSELLSNPSEKFKKYKEIYLPLVKDYKFYNDELINVIESHISFLKVLDWRIGLRGERFKQELMQMSYYTQCYVNRNKPPYRSIIYLDNMIDRYLKVLDKTEESVEQEIKEILENLR